LRASAASRGARAVGFSSRLDPETFMASLDAMLALLVKALREPTNRTTAVERFQSLVWESPKGEIAQGAYDVFADLAYDLNFFVADPAHRAEDSSYYGDGRLEREIRETFERLAERGVTVPDESVLE
jgi:hypothetical protein